MSDITENLIHTSDAVSSPSSSSDELQGLSRTHLLQQKCPKKWPPWQAWWKTKESQTGSYSTHKKW